MTGCWTINRCTIAIFHRETRNSFPIARTLTELSALLTNCLWEKRSVSEVSDKRSFQKRNGKSLYQNRAGLVCVNKKSRIFLFARRHILQRSWSGRTFEK